METRATRRRFLKQALAGAAAVAGLADAQASRAQGAAGTGPPVVVIGAGLAGLAAAFRLQQAGQPVAVIEARHAPGGRVRTLHDAFVDGQYAEAGPTRIAEVHVRCLRYARELGLELEAYAPADATGLLLKNGSRISAAEACDQANPTLALHAAERGLTAAALLARYVGTLPPTLADAAPGTAAYADWRDYDRSSWPEWLRARGASADAVALMTLGADSRDLSALYVLRQIALHRGARRYFKIAGGMDRLPSTLAARLGPIVRYGTAVMRIAHGPDGVRVTFTESGREAGILASAVVLAVPLPALRRLAILPGLSMAKRAATEEVPCYGGTRIALQTRSRCWRRSGQSGYARTDGPAELAEATFGQAGTRGILSLTTSGRALRGLGEAACLQRGVELAAAAFPALREEFERGAVIRWEDEPGAGGAFAAFRPGQMSVAPLELARPEGRLHFAGEHTSPWMGWMEGALESGERASRELLAPLPS